MNATDVAVLGKDLIKVQWKFGEEMKKGGVKVKEDSERQYIPNISAQPALGKLLCFSGQKVIKTEKEMMMRF